MRMTNPIKVNHIFLPFSYYKKNVRTLLGFQFKYSILKKCVSHFQHYKMLSENFKGHENSGRIKENLRGPHVPKKGTIF